MSFTDSTQTSVYDRTEKAAGAGVTFFLNRVSYRYSAESPTTYPLGTSTESLSVYFAMLKSSMCCRAPQWKAKVFLIMAFPRLDEFCDGGGFRVSGPLKLPWSDLYLGSEDLYWYVYVRENLAHRYVHHGNDLHLELLFGRSPIGTSSITHGAPRCQQGGFSRGQSRGTFMLQAAEPVCSQPG